MGQLILSHRERIKLRNTVKNFRITIDGTGISKNGESIHTHGYSDLCFNIHDFIDPNDNRNDVHTEYNKLCRIYDQTLPSTITNIGKFFCFKDFEKYVQTECNGTVYAFFCEQDEYTSDDTVFIYSTDVEDASAISKLSFITKSSFPMMNFSSQKRVTDVTVMRELLEFFGEDGVSPRFKINNRGYSTKNIISDIAHTDARKDAFKLYMKMKYADDISF